jgi:hypothetical protein
MLDSNSFNNWNDFVPDICIYHSIAPFVPCPDGIASAWIVWKKFISKNPFLGFIGMNYKDVDSHPWLEYENRKIIVVDFSIPLSLVKKLEERGNQVLIIDHHKSFYSDFQELFSQKSYSFDGYKFNENSCGALLCWELFFPYDIPPTFLLYVNDRDLFKKSLPDSDIIHLSMGCSGDKNNPKFSRNFDTFNQLEFDESIYGWDYVKNYLYPVGNHYKNLRDEKITKIISNPKKFLHWDEVPIIFLNSAEMALKGDISEHVMKSLEKSEDYFFCVVINKKDLSRIRVKTILDIDLLALFSEFDVTGHSSACGFPWFASMEELKEIIVQKYWKCF